MCCKFNAHNKKWYPHKSQPSDSGVYFATCALVKAPLSKLQLSKQDSIEMMVWNFQSLVLSAYSCLEIFLFYKLFIRGDFIPRQTCLLPVALFFAWWGSERRGRGFRPSSSPLLWCGSTSCLGGKLCGWMFVARTPYRHFKVTAEKRKSQPWHRCVARTTNEESTGSGFFLNFDGH